MIYPGGHNIAFAVASTVDSDDPVVISDRWPGVATQDYQTATGKANINIGAENPVYDLSVQAVNDQGNTTIAIGDAIYYDSGNTVVLTAKKTGLLFGYALEAITTVGGTSTIYVMLAEATDKDASARFTYEDFEVSPVAAGQAGTAVLGTTGSVNVMNAGKEIFEYHIKGTQTIKVPVLAAGGLNIGLDQTDNDGVEITQGILSRSKAAFTVGTDAFYMRVRFSIATVAGTDDCIVGFRKTQAYQTAIATYTDYCGLNVIAGDIYAETGVNGADVSTDTTDTWADAATHELAVYVSAAGAVTYKIDGAAPTVTAAITMDTGDVLVPFMFMLQANAAQTGAVLLKEWEVGLQ